MSTTTMVNMTTIFSMLVGATLVAMPTSAQAEEEDFLSVEWLQLELGFGLATGDHDAPVAIRACSGLNFALMGLKLRGCAETLDPGSILGNLAHLKPPSRAHLSVHGEFDALFTNLGLRLGYTNSQAESVSEENRVGGMLAAITTTFYLGRVHLRLEGALTKEFWGDISVLGVVRRANDLEAMGIIYVGATAF